MSQYLTSLVLVSALVGVCTYASYGESSERCVKGATALMLVYVIIAPLISLAYSFATENFYEYGQNSPEFSIEDTEFGKSAEEAFEIGIKKYLKEEFSVAEGDLTVAVFGFNAAEMKAEKIKIILSGKGALLDSRAICEEINEMNIGKCEVELRVKQ